MSTIIDCARDNLRAALGLMGLTPAACEQILADGGTLTIPASTVYGSRAPAVPASGTPIREQAVDRLDAAADAHWDAVLGGSRLVVQADPPPAPADGRSVLDQALDQGAGS